MIYLRKNIIRLILVLIIFIQVVITGDEIYSESIDDIDGRAEEYYKNKDFNKAIAEWLNILEIDPKNEDIQKKIEAVFYEKFKKDNAYQTARMQHRIAKSMINTNLKECNEREDTAMDNLIVAFRIDPKDPKLQELRDDMKEFSQVLSVENRKKRLSEALRQKYMELLPLAREKMRMKQYEESLGIWKEMLSIVPLDAVANEGKRQAELAIENRLKYERLMALLESGIALFNTEKYQESELEFKQALTIDPKNRDAKSYLEKINEILQDKRDKELIRLQAEQLYASGIANIKKKNFDMAEEDFKNVISLIENYKDAAERLRSIERLRKEYEEQQRLAKLKIIDAQFEAGLLALTDGKYKDAIVALEAVLNLDPKNSLALKYIQTAKEAREQIEEERVTEDSPYYSIVNSLEVSGKLLYERGEYSESRRRWEKILDLFPKNRIATEYLLKCNIKINPDSFSSNFLDKYIAEGKALIKEKRFRDALTKFELVKSIEAKYPGIDALIASAKVTAIPKQPALAAPEEINARIKRGLDYYAKGGEENIKLALLEFQWVNKNDPDNTRALIYLNKIESQLRNAAGAAVKAIRRLSAKDEDLMNKYYYKGMTYYFNNRFEDAIAEWRKVTAINPDHEQAKMNIRKCLALMKR